MSRNDIISITIVNNVSVTLPASKQLMTTFILQEQNDWFEDEIKFIRHFIKPGMKVIDIGANYGLYTLSIAKIIGENGKVWAFEPTEFTASCLKKSISENKFNNVIPIQAGLSDKLGKAKLFTSPNSELNSLSKEATGSNQYETISLLTLDYCMQKYGWKEIDFIKLDAEGEEFNILRKGKKTLFSLSPLIMFELKHGESVNLPLINRFRNMEYNSYRLIPGLNILVPFKHNETFDGYLLNLFCCKDDKAIQLENEGVIVRNCEIKYSKNYSLAKEYIGKMEYWKSMKNNIPKDNSIDSVDYLEVLNTYILSLSKSESNFDRVSYLMSSLKKLRKMLIKGEQSIERLVTFSRIAFDAGERAFGVEILSNLINKYHTNFNFEIKELFLPASKRYENIVPNNKINEWLFSSILEQYIKKHAFSSYFTQRASLPLFEKLNNIGFINEEMRKRYYLVKEIFSIKK